MFDSKTDRRFRRPEFQQKLRRARQFERKPEPLPETFWSSFFHRLGLRSFLGRGSALFLILLVAYFLFVSRIFLVKNVIAGPGSITGGQVEEVLRHLGSQRYFLIPRSHVLLLRSSSLFSETQKLYPEVRRVKEFSVDVPDTARVTFEMREASYVWQSGDRFYLLDQDGVVFQVVSGYDPEIYHQTLIRDQSARAVSVGQPVDSPLLIHFVEQLKRLWPEQVREVGFLSVSLPAARSLDMFAKTDLGFSVYFDLERSAQIQLANLSYILSQQIKPETYGGLSYIDLRLPDRAYYCYKDASCAPENATSTQSLNQ